MKILHTISSLGINSGGPPLSTTLAVKGVKAQDVDVDILTYYPSEKDQNIIEENYTHFLPAPLERKFGYSKQFGDYLENKRYDIYHCQGIWQYPTYITAKKAREFNKPYLITPRGMLYPQQLKKKDYHKKIAMALFLKSDLQNAACIHATCIEEMNHIRNLGIDTPIAVIPNPIETENILEKKIIALDKIRFGYLGRVHPRKNIERILYAWKKLDFDKQYDVELVIIGSGDDDYLKFLKTEANRLNIDNIEFTGFLSGQKKEDKLLSLSYLVVPSDFENFGMIVAESLVRGIPVIASKGTPWQDINTYNCGWWVDNDVDTLAETIDYAKAMPEEKRITKGYNGKKLIREKYTKEIVGEKFTNIYKWILGDTEKPDFVYTI